MVHIVQGGDPATLIETNTRPLCSRAREHAENKEYMIYSDLSKEVRCNHVASFTDDCVVLVQLPLASSILIRRRIAGKRGIQDGTAFIGLGNCSSNNVA